MGSVRQLSGRGTLFLDFRYLGQRCREYTALPDTPANRKRLEKALAKIEADIAAGTFDYSATFPGSRNIPARDPAPAPVPDLSTPAVPASASATAVAAALSPTPSFKDFTATWMSEPQIEAGRQAVQTLKMSPWISSL